MVQGQAPGEGQTKAPAGPQPGRVSEEAVREELARVLSCHEFRSSKRSQEFLRYVVEHTLSGHADMLKERTIGIEVFGRSTSYEPSDDATVRVKAGDVRKRLGLYYAEQGAHNPVRIEVPAGTYVPEFRWSEVHDATAPVSPVVVVPDSAAVVSIPPVQPRAFGRLYLVGGAVLIAIGIAAALWMRARPAETALDQFWSPVLKGTSPVSLCVAFVPVYGLKDRERSGRLCAFDGSICRRGRPGRDVAYFSHAGADAASLSIEGGERCFVPGFTGGAGDSGGVLIYSLERDQQSVAILHRHLAGAGRDYRQRPRRRNLRFRISLPTGALPKTMRSFPECSIRIRTRCWWNWRASRNMEPKRLRIW